METKIIVEVKNIYGKRLVYPACETSKLLARIAGKKTIGDHLASIKALGYGIEVKAAEL